MPKMEIACNTVIREGMEVETHWASKEVQDTQAAVMEFLLINHPLDCTVCDQAGHCKLQDYHYEYNARPSRFLEDKGQKEKAVSLGPTVMLDAERCIACTRCVRFCDEVTGTSELGMLNRGDRYTIAVAPGKDLDNALSGTVVDLCPVGALTHKNWRFNSRIWFTEKSTGICPGCSTGCNTTVHERDGEIVQVKARLNAAVNKEWLCDEGRYGYNRFTYAERVTAPQVGAEKVGLDLALKEFKSVLTPQALVLLAPNLLLEEYWILKRLFEEVGVTNAVVAYFERPLTDIEKILVSPDYAANFRAAEFCGFQVSESRYREALSTIAAGAAPAIVTIGDHAIWPEHLTPGVARGLNGKLAALLGDARSPLASAARVRIPARGVLEKSGLMINRAARLQYSDRALTAPAEALSAWQLALKVAALSGVGLGSALNDREFTLQLLTQEPRLNGLTIPLIKAGGVPLAQAAGAALVTNQVSA
jgi:NADH-quinone oxidoreductase subunit G